MGEGRMKWKPLKRLWFSVVCSVYHQLKLVVNARNILPEKKRISDSMIVKSYHINHLLFNLRNLQDISSG